VELNLTTSFGEFLIMPDIKTLLLQVSVILIASYTIGWLLSRLHQPQVVGEMVAGVLLGPSLLGWIAPRLSAALFPPASLPLLYSLSQVGLVLFMFMVGLAIKTKKLRRLGAFALVISPTSIIVPFLLGAMLAFYLYPRIADSSIPFTGFVLFMGAAMSVTAFPVLSRILSEQDLLDTRVGTLTIACAAVDDVTAWCILATIIAIVRSRFNHLALWEMLVGLAAYLCLMLFVLKPIVRSIFAGREGAELTDTTIASLLLCALASSWVTEWLGIHALFGAFFAGVIMPKEKLFSEGLPKKLRPLVVLFLVPLFFAFTGLRTSVVLITSSSMLLYCGLILMVAGAGKFGGAMLAARLVGIPWNEAAAIGVLMNTRGMIELVILNIGLDIGVLTRPLFSMMVVMAVGTTLMTSPLLALVYPRARRTTSRTLRI